MSGKSVPLVRPINGYVRNYFHPMSFTKLDVQTLDHVTSIRMARESSGRLGLLFEALHALKRTDIYNASTGSYWLGDSHDQQHKLVPGQFLIDFKSDLLVPITQKEWNSLGPNHRLRISVGDDPLMLHVNHNIGRGAIAVVSDVHEKSFATGLAILLRRKR